MITSYTKIYKFFFLTIVCAIKFLSIAEVNKIQRSKAFIQHAKTINFLESHQTTSYDFCIFITTYNRPKLLLQLLQNIENEQNEHKILIKVHNDCSSENYQEVEDYINTRSWIEYSVSKTNMGKKNFWRTISNIYQELININSRYFFSLQDDYYLVPDFFAKSTICWNKINDEKKICLNLVLENQRFNHQVWGSKILQDVGPAYLSGWVDMAFMCEKKFFELLNFRIKSISPDRWTLNKNLSSGVGEYHTKFLRSNGYHLYQVKKSLIDIRDVPSEMHDSERKKHPQHSLNLDDQKKITHEKISASMATMPSRVILLKKVVETILPQVDTLYVYLNGHKIIPDFLYNPKIVLAHSDDFGDRGDAGKFFWADKINGYHFTIDDDLNYPENYVNYCINKIEQFGRAAIIGFHGVILYKKIQNYYLDRLCIHFWSPLNRDRFVHILGTGTTAYHTDAIRIKPDDFHVKNMADIWLGILAQKQKVPMICMARRKNYLTEMEVTQSIAKQFFYHCPIQTEIVKKHNWVIHKK